MKLFLKNLFYGFKIIYDDFFPYLVLGLMTSILVFLHSGLILATFVFVSYMVPGVIFSFEQLKHKEILNSFQAYKRIVELLKAKMEADVFILEELTKEDEINIDQIQMLADSSRNIIITLNGRPPYHGEF